MASEPLTHFMDGVTPAGLGLPDKFQEFRHAQILMIERSMNSTKRFVAHACPTGGGKSAGVVGEALYTGNRTVVLTSTKGLQTQYCLAPDTPVLRGDLRWVQVGSLVAGDNIVGFDEYPRPNRRRWRGSVVLRTARITQPCYQLTLEDGTEVVCSSGHKWLTKTQCGVNTWTTTEHLRAGGKCASRIIRVLDMWDRNSDHDYAVGYLAAAFDGEGHLSQRLYNHDQRGMVADVGLCFAQTLNPMLDEVKRLLSQMKFSYSTFATPLAPGRKASEVLALSHRSEVLRFLGQIRPHRLLPQWDIERMGMIGPTSRVRVLKKEFLGEMEVVALSTSTKTLVAAGLASHNCDDFTDCGLVSVKGKANFRCCKSTAGQPLTCEEGSSMGCRSIKAGECPYKQQYVRAVHSPLVTTNYAYWCLINRFGEGLGQVDTLVLDEAHNAPTQVSEQVNTPISEREVEGMLRAEWPKEWRSMPEWRAWAQTHLPVAKMLQEKLTKDCMVTADRDTLRMALAWRSLAAKLQTITSMVGPWVVEPRQSRGRSDGYRLQAVWPYTYAEKLLFLNVPKIILISATINLKTLSLLGIKRSECDFYEYGASFDPGRSPVYFLPTVALNHKTGPDEFSLVVGRVDEIVSERLDRKGIIHTTSYQRAQDIVAQSQYADLMLLHDSKDAAETIQYFKTAPAPTILVSPSVTTGYDFPMDQCEYQIIVKAPYPDLRGAVQSKRREEDWLYPTYEMAQVLVQATGRGTRTPHDHCENFIVDDTVRKAFQRSESLFPKWWREQVIVTDLAPEPPPPLIEDPEVSLQELADADQSVTVPDEIEDDCPLPW
jgi:hypothetical protein